MPRGRSFPFAFGMNTRLTGRARLGDQQISITRRSLSAADRATRPSTPGVRRPALRSVTCRTLNSVFDRTSKHQLLQAAYLLQVAGSRRREDPLPQPSYPVLDGTPIHSVPSPGPRPRVRSPDPTRRRRPSVQLVPWFQRLVIRSLRRPTRSTSALFRGGPPGPVSRPVIRRDHWRGVIVLRRFPVTFRRTGIRLLDHPVPAADSASLTDRPTSHRLDRNGVPTLHTHETRSGWAPS